MLWSYGPYPIGPILLIEWVFFYPICSKHIDTPTQWDYIRLWQILSFIGDSECESEIYLTYWHILFTLSTPVQMIYYETPHYHHPPFFTGLTGFHPLTSSDFVRTQNSINVHIWFRLVWGDTKPFVCHRMIYMLQCVRNALLTCRSVHWIVALTHLWSRYKMAPTGYVVIH